MITEDYVSFETAKFLKDRGFNEKCRQYYYKDNLIHSRSEICNEEFNNYKEVGEGWSASTLQMARKWLREKYHLHIEIRITNHSMSDMVNIIKYYWVMTNTETGRWCDESTIYTAKVFDKSEEAEEDAIRHALEKYV